MRSLALIIAFIGFTAFANAQQPIRKLPAKRTTASIKIDGELSEDAWKEATPATDFVEWRPSAGTPEANKTIVYLLYDNTSIYIGGYCHEKTKDSISRELIGRDRVGVNDFVGIILDTYNDKINAVGFYVTPYGEQYDAKYSATNGEDDSWNAVWTSEAKIHSDGWSFEVRIPYSALRFVSRDNQTWGLNITRRRNKTGQQYMWNPIDPNKNGFVNQEGEWTGIGKIESPLRLSFSPYVSLTSSRYPYRKTTGNPNEKDFTTAFNGGMDVKYGISESFTLDMTLVPDFGQVRSDNKVLNLGPFEQIYSEQRPFFTEGTELFTKGNLFYSRRIGQQPLHYNDVDSWKLTGETVAENPQTSKLINATKISGRTKKGLGIGIFNAITKPMYAVFEDGAHNKRKLETDPLTNYNILVLDQTLKNNSSVSLINTNVLREGAERDANVTAGLFDFNNKKNTYNWNGKFVVSQVNDPILKHFTGYSHNIGFGKTGGRWNFQIGQELANDKYDINDLGTTFNNNYIDHYFWSGYKWNKPKNWYKSVQLNFNINHSQVFKKFPNQKINSRFQHLNANLNGNAQLKNLWFVGGFIGYVPQGNDFYETRQNDPIVHTAADGGSSFRSTERAQFEIWAETNSAKKYKASFDYFIGIRDQFNSRNHRINFNNRYRFNDRFSLQHNININPFSNDAGFYGFSNTGDILFTRRDWFTSENSLSVKYSFSKRSDIRVDVRHYWSKVKNKELFTLNTDGTLSSIGLFATEEYSNFNSFYVNATYTLQFAPGSFIYIVYKDENNPDKVRFDSEDRIFKSFDRAISAPQKHILSLKVVYYLDYLDFKKWKKKDKQ